jgi:tetratricopeptide (TPR) repeat protein
MSKSILIFSVLVLLGCTSKVEEFNQQGHLNFLLGNRYAAESYYSKAIAIDQKNSEAYFGRGLSTASSVSREHDNWDLSSKNREYAEAITDFTKVIEIEPQNAEAYRCRGFIKHRFSR